MGIDFAFDGLRKIREDLILLAILEESAGEVKTNDWIKKYKKLKDIPEFNRESLEPFKKRIEEWGKDAGRDIVSSVNRNDNGTKRSPYRFALKKDDEGDKKIYIEYLRIAFAMLLVKKGELDFLHSLINRNYPLTILMKLVNSISGEFTSKYINLTYENNNVPVVTDIKVLKIHFETGSSEWNLYCKDSRGNHVTIPILSIISVK